jgi:lysophospholipase L1-like esterase
VAGRLRALTALAAAPLLLALTGCGSADHGTPEAKPVVGSARASDRASSTPRAAHPRALFFGDSYIIGGGYTGPQDSMGAIASRHLGWSYRVRGGGGTGFVSGNAEYGIPPFLGQIRQGALDVGPVDWLVVEGGGNDKDADPGVVTRRAVRTLRAAATRHPEARLVLVGTMDPTIDSFTDTDGVIAALAAAAQQLGIPFVDAQHWLEGHPQLIGPDYDHPTPAGHRLCGRKLARALASLG